MTTDTAIKGMVLYCDGGARPNPGFGGVGVHGYLYAAVSPTKGMGRNFEVTSQGYFDKGEAKVLKDGEGAKELLEAGEAFTVTPLKYVDITLAPQGVTTNNICELVATMRGLQYALKEDIQFLTILTDSEYTRKGLSEHMSGWLANDWIKRDGTPVANQEWWKPLNQALEDVRAKGINVIIDRVAGHSGEVGNDRADMLASIGVFDNQRGHNEEYLKETEPELYWKQNANRHPFVSARRCYFSAQSANVPGVYHLGDHGKDDELLGKRASDGRFSVVRLEDPDDVIELVRKHQASLAGMSDSIFALLIDQIFDQDLYKTVEQFGTRSLKPPAGYRLDLEHLNKKPLSREFKPPRLADRAIGELQNLESILDLYERASPDLKVTEITADLYDFTEKKHPPKKGQSEGVTEIVTKLKAEIGVGLPDITVKAALPFEGMEELEDLKLTMGLDILERNSLKRLETLNPHVYVVTWSVSETAYRYATIIRAGGSVGIWCGVYSNLRLLKPKAAKA